MKKALLPLLFCFFMHTAFCQGTYIVALRDAYKEFNTAIAAPGADVNDAGKKAIKQIKKVEKEYKRFGWCDASYYSALVYKEMKEYDKAVEAIDECTPDSANHDHEIEQRVVLKAQVLDIQGKYQQAIEAYLKAQYLYDKQSHELVYPYYYGKSLRYLYAMVEDYENALKYNYVCDTTYGINKTLAGVYHKYLAEKNMAVPWEEMFKAAQEKEKAGDNDAAYEKYTAAIGLNDIYADAYYHRGILGLKMKKFTEAQQDLSKCYNHLNWQFPRLQFLVYIAGEAAGKFNDNYYSFYDLYPASDRTKLLQEFGIAPASQFVVKPIRDAKKARDAEAERLANARYEEERRRNAPPAVTQPKAETVCTCDKCGGSGKISFKTFKTWDEVLERDNYGAAKRTVTKSGYVYEDQTCTRCLGTGKCK